MSAGVVFDPVVGSVATTAALVVGGAWVPWCTSVTVVGETAMVVGTLVVEACTRRLVVVSGAEDVVEAGNDVVAAAVVVGAAVVLVGGFVQVVVGVLQRGD